MLSGLSFYLVPKLLASDLILTVDAAAGKAGIWPGGSLQNSELGGGGTFLLPTRLRAQTKSSRRVPRAPRASPHPAPFFPRGPRPDPGPLPGSGRAEGSARCRASRTPGLPPYRSPTTGPDRGIAAAPGAPLGELWSPRAAPQVIHAGKVRSRVSPTLAQRWQGLITIQLRVYLSLPPPASHPFNKLK